MPYLIPDQGLQLSERYKGRLDRPGIRHRLISELARGEVSQRKLAIEFGVSAPSITAFKRRYEREITECREAKEKALDGLWIARKYDRLATYQGLAERAQDAIEEMREEALREGDTEGLWLRSAEFDRLARVLAMALRSAAEEVGGLVQRQEVKVSDERARHVIEGVLLEDL